MAKAKTIDLFGQLNGLDFHIALEPSDSESGLDVLIKSVEYLVSKGAQPRPTPGRGKAGGQGPIPTACPSCNAPVIIKDWTAKDGKQMKLHKCSKDESHLKRFVPA